MSLVRNIATIGGWTFLYRISCFVRDIAQSHLLGAGLFSDVFSISFKFANSLRKLFAEGAFNASFLPIFSGALKDKGHDEAQKIASQIFTWLTLWLSCFSILCLIFYREIMGAFAPGIDPSSEKCEHLILIGRISSPYVAASFLAAMFGGILNTINRFAVASAAQLTLNIFVIGALFLGPLWFPSVAYTMAWATFLAGVGQVLFLWGNAKYRGFNIGFDFSSKKQETKLFFKKLVSGAVGSGVLQLNILIDFVVLSFLPTGAVSYFYYVDHLYQFPVGILGIAFSVAMLPPLTRAIHRKDNVVAQKQMNLGLLFALAFALPASVILLSLSEQIVGTIYGRGNFTREHVAAAYPVLAALAYGLPFYMATKALSAVFFANKDTRAPFIGGIISIFVNLLFIALLTPYMRHVGIAWATTSASFCNWAYLAIKLRKRCNIKVERRAIKGCSKLLLISAFMLTTILSLNDYAISYYLNEGIERSVALLCVSGAGLLVFFIAGKIVNAFSFMKEITSFDDKTDE